VHANISTRGATSLDDALNLPTKRETLKYLGDHARAKLGRGESITIGEERLLIISALLAELRNGGFDQFLWNSSGDNTHETIAALYAIGAMRTAGLLTQALQLFPSHAVPKSREERCKILGTVELEAKRLFTRLNSDFLILKEDYVSLLYQDAVEHKNDFA